MYLFSVEGGSVLLYIFQSQCRMKLPAIGSELPTLAEISQPLHISIAFLRIELTYMDFKVISIILKEGGT